MTRKAVKTIFFADTTTDSLTSEGWAQSKALSNEYIPSRDTYLQSIVFHQWRGHTTAQLNNNYSLALE